MQNMGECVIQRIKTKDLTSKIVITSIVASLYASLTVVLGSLGYSWIQIRISESLTPLPFLFGLPAVAGLTLGCIIANMFSPVGLPDIIFGPLLTLLAALLSWRVNGGKKAIACIYPVLINAVGVSAYVASFYNVPYIVSLLSIALGEFVAAGLVGYPLLEAIERIIRKSSIKQSAR
jgi:uncharacterized membrane protein